jgi:hypothetical protein
VDFIAWRSSVACDALNWRIRSFNYFSFSADRCSRPASSSPHRMSSFSLEAMCVSRLSRDHFSSLMFSLARVTLLALFWSSTRHLCGSSANSTFWTHWVLEFGPWPLAWP